MTETIETRLMCGRENCNRNLVLKDKSDCLATCEGEEGKKAHALYAVSTKFLDRDILEPSPLPVYITATSVIKK